MGWRERNETITTSLRTLFFSDRARDPPRGDGSGRSRSCKRLHTDSSNRRERNASAVTDSQDKKVEAEIAAAHHRRCRHRRLSERLNITRGRVQRANIRFSSGAIILFGCSNDRWKVFLSQQLIAPSFSFPLFRRSSHKGSSMQTGQPLNPFFLSSLIFGTCEKPRYIIEKNAISTNDLVEYIESWRTSSLSLSIHFVIREIVIA